MDTNSLYQQQQQQQAQTPAQIQIPTTPAGVPQSLLNGTWEPVDMKGMGFTINGAPNTPVMGPDGAYYVLGKSEPEFTAISANQQTAIPTPSSIVQLPPIVQPLALVPFASQNQPMLQYDPYSRPVEPVAPVEPKYIKKPYRGMSAVLFILSIVALAALALLSIIRGLKSDTSAVDFTTYTTKAYDLVIGLLMLFGVKLGSGSVYYEKMLKPSFADGVLEGIKANPMNSICYILIPIFSVIIFIVLIVLVIKYLVRLAKKKSPAGFSIGAFINLILSIATIVMIYGVAKNDALNIVPYLGIYVVAILSLVMFIIPFFAKKHAYIIDEAQLKRTFIVDPDRKVKNPNPTL